MLLFVIPLTAITLAVTAWRSLRTDRPSVIHREQGDARP
jgi:hypothetical protein